MKTSLTICEGKLGFILAKVKQRTDGQVEWQ